MKKIAENFYTVVFNGDKIDSVSMFDPDKDELPDDPANTFYYDEITDECYVSCRAKDEGDAGRIASDLRRAYLEGTLKNED